MKKIMYFAAALLVLVGCNKNSQTNKENAPQEIVTIKGGIVLPKTPNKIAAPEGWESAEGEFGMRWEENDQIYIYNGLGECSLFTIASGVGDSEATFNGSPLSSMDGYSVAYGYNPKGDYKGEATYPTYPVPYIEGNYRPFAEGEGTTDGFSIDNFGPVIGLQLKGNGAFSKIEVALLAENKTKLAIYTMTFEETLILTEEVTKVYFPIQAKEGAVKIAISFYKKVNSEEVLALTKTTNMPEANNVTTFPVLTFQSAYEYVDLGLTSGLKWATCNVGATAPEGYGDYFAWGETEPYYTGLNADGSATGWKTGKGTGYTWQSYCGESPVGEPPFKEWDPVPYDENKILKSEHDAAYVNWGSNWRMPTRAELDELLDYCTWTWTTLNNISGYEVKGLNNNTIFLPASGGFRGSSLDGVGSNGFYRSSSLYGDDSHWAYLLIFSSDGEMLDYYDRCFGFSIRPVCPKEE